MGFRLSRQSAVVHVGQYAEQCEKEGKETVPDMREHPFRRLNDSIRAPPAHNGPDYYARKYRDE